MKQFNLQSKIPPKVLATDLDGTLIPLKGEADNEAALHAIAESYKDGDFKLIFATGRHRESVMDAIHVHRLPLPDWLICDVGSSIFVLDEVKQEFHPFRPYQKHLEELTHGINRTQVEGLLYNVAEITLQEPERQQEFKISYVCESSRTNTLVNAINESMATQDYPFFCTGSVDPFENCGLLDVLPVNVSKAYALVWLSSHADFLPDEVVFAGDSGNDKAALVSGFRAILVGNASAGLAGEIETALRSSGFGELFYHAKGTATSGVLEGCRHFGLFE